MNDTSPDLLTVGWREWVGLPDLGVPRIKAKIDSGARTSCLHTSEYHIFQKDGIDWVQFTLHPIKKDQSIEFLAQAPVFDYRTVRDSGGHEEHRPFVQTTLKIGNQHWPIEVSLSNRANMKFRMLLGRTTIAERMLIDCSRSYLTKSQPHLSQP